MSKDINKHVQKAAEEAAKVYHLTLERIAHPIKYLQELADKDGVKLDGVNAIALSNDANWLKQLAQQALAGTQWKGDEVEVLKKDEIPSRTDPRNWTEDYGHENGNYMCHCYNCQRTFFGHKRRVVCKECSDKYESELDKAKKEIERLKGHLETLVKEKAYDGMVRRNEHNTADAIHECIEYAWDNFKSENNL